MRRVLEWISDPGRWIELFVIVNLAFLTIDIWFAHSMNDFEHHAEWMPFGVSLVTPPILIIALILDSLGRKRPWRVIGHLVGAACVALGVAGMLYHLESQFFEEQTLENLVYTAPFVAPLAYTGVGLLLIMNRMTESGSGEWARWVVTLALGGFIGNFILALADHAQNRFFYATEWIPVFSSAMAVGFLIPPLIFNVKREFLVVCFLVLGIQFVVGVLGFWLHTAANLKGPADYWFDNFVFGAPAFAPLLFPNLVVLAALGLWVMLRRYPGRTHDAP